MTCCVHLVQSTVVPVPCLLPLLRSAQSHSQMPQSSASQLGALTSCWWEPKGKIKNSNGVRFISGHIFSMADAFKYEIVERRIDELCVWYDSNCRWLFWRRVHIFSWLWMMFWIWRRPKLLTNYSQQEKKNKRRRRNDWKNNTKIKKIIFRLGLRKRLRIIWHVFALCLGCAQWVPWTGSEKNKMLWTFWRRTHLNVCLACE